MTPIKLGARRRFITAGAAVSGIGGLLFCVGLLSAQTPGSDVPPDTDTLQPSPGSPPPRFFGVTHLNSSNVARLHFANPELPGPGPKGPAVVRLEFRDSVGNVLLRKGPEVVMPGTMTSLDLLAEELAFPPDSHEVGVRGLVTFYNPQARGLASLQIEGSTADSSVIVFDRLATSPYLVRKLDPLCTHPMILGTGSLLRLNVTNVGDRGFPAALLTADLVIYNMRPRQTALARKTVQLTTNQSDSLALENVEGELFGTVEFKDSASRAVAAGTYEFRHSADGSLKYFNLTTCGGPWDSSSTSGGGPTNSGGAG